MEGRIIIIRNLIQYLIRVVGHGGSWLGCVRVGLGWRRKYFLSAKLQQEANGLHRDLIQLRPGSQSTRVPCLAAAASK